MDHTHIITAAQLEQYADTRDSQSVIPELIYWLVRQSASSISVCRIPYGDAVNQPGNDGLVEVDAAFLEFVPKGRSYWEIGTGADPQSKATSDFKKRTDGLESADRSLATFIFVTPRSSGADGWNEPEQAKWLKARDNQGWQSVRVLDGVKLADWLREFPSLGRWMWKKLGLSKGQNALTTPTEHWETIQAQIHPNDPPLPPKVFMVGRDNACAALQKLFQGESQRLLLFAESTQDVDDFVAAYLASLDDDTRRSMTNRCLFINDEDAWHSVVVAKAAHVLVAHPRLGLDSEGAKLQTEATKRGHAVVIPVCGAWSAENREIIRLRSPSQSLLEAAFTEAGYPTLRARELASAGADRLSALHRHFLGLGGLPPYATWGNARLLAQAGLFGKWDGKSHADQIALGAVLGKTYGEWIEIVRGETLRSDTPLIQRDEQWRMVARGEAWSALGARVSDEDLDKLLKTAVLVLGERDPKFDLPKEERFAAGVHGKQLSHSHRLREGLAETLALLGSRPEALVSCSHGKPEATAILAVRELLENADWCRWAGLDSLLPLLAEAAPDEFLDAVETALVNLEKSPFHQLFAQEGTGGFGGWNYTSGLLWALETLAWHADYLSRVTLILGDLAAIDPGGTWSNRPSNSLADIFLPWHLQTCASQEKRKSVVKALLREQREVGWNLLLALLPNNHGFTSGCRRPAWRNWISDDWKESITNREYWDQISAYTSLAIGIAKLDITKLAVLIERLPDLPEDAQSGLLAHLESAAISELPERNRTSLWDALVEIVRKHRRFAYTDWAMPKDAVDRIEVTASKLAPKSTAMRHQFLFSERDFDLYDENSDYEAQRKKLDLRRQQAVQELLNEGGFETVKAFAQMVAAPIQVGLALGNIANKAVEMELLPALLENGDAVQQNLVGGFVWSRFWKLSWPWVDEMLDAKWSAQQMAQFLVLLPFVEDVWRRAEHALANDESLYWIKARVNPWNPHEKLTRAVEKLILYKRPNAAVQCLARLADEEVPSDSALATRALLAVLDSGEADKELDCHSIVKVISWLQKSPSADSKALFKIEWNFLPLLGRFSGGSPKILEQRLAEDPAFFCEVIGLIFRSKKEKNKDVEPTEVERNMARNAYKLLDEWRTVPGMKDDGSFDAASFSSWLVKMKQMTDETGHLEIATSQLGQVLPYSPADADGLWIHHIVAEALNAKDAKRMRSGFTMELFNQRGVHGFTAGKEERALAKRNREKADALDARGYSRFATAMREFAERYERAAEREESRDPYSD
jgi:hypothetical protein